MFNCGLFQLLIQEEHNQSLQQQLQHQELTLAREEKKHLKQELQLLRSKDQKLLDQINNLGSFLHRVTPSYRHPRHNYRPNHSHSARSQWHTKVFFCFNHLANIKVLSLWGRLALKA